MIDFRVICHNSRQRKDGKTQVLICALINNQKTVFLGTGIFVEQTQFENGFIVKHENAPRLNAELSRQLYAIQSWSLDFLRKNKKITPKQLKAYHEHSGQSLVQFCRQSIESDHNLSKGTKKRYRVLVNHIEVFDKKANINEVGEEWIKGFDKYLVENNISQNTRITMHKAFRSFLNRAARTGLIDKDQIYRIKIKEKPSDRSALTERELQRIEQLELNPYLSIIQDMFLFSSYTGLRFQDLITLTARNFREGEEGLELHFRAKKTQKLLTLPLELIFDAKPAALAWKYLQKISKGKELESRIFKDITHQYANRCMREIALKAKIFKKVTMHVGRHTFATIMATKVPTKVLQELLQHSKIETTMIYVHLSNKSINESLKKAFDK